jgi:peptide-methionine (S)-S-oxide reductase
MPLFSRRTPQLVDPASALPGRERELAIPARHEVLGTPLRVDRGERADGTPKDIEQAIFGMGCFWGAERLFWQAPGVYTTAVGYAGGYTPNPTYEEVCSGRTGHAEVVLVAFDTAATSFQEMLRIFWEGHDPTQAMRQGNDVGTQYRSLILWRGDAQREQAEASRLAYQQVLSAAGHGEIATELVQADPAHPFYYAEDYHQQYLAKNPGAYCGAGGTGVACPVGLPSQRSAPAAR